MTWADLSAIIACLPPDSALLRAYKDDWMWGLPEMLAADIADSLRWLTWAKTTDAQKNRNPPKPIPRPGIAKPERIGEPLSIADMNEFLDWKV